MTPLFAVIACFFVYFIGYKFYSKFLAEKIFNLRGSEVKTPAHTLRDGIDYVPTKPSILFGHHYASIAGLAPILGPAVAVIWGWLPAMLWVVGGAILIGCVHDMGALIISIRHDGKSIGQVAETLLGHRARTLFHIMIFFLVSLAMGVFVLVLSGLFSAPPIKTSTQEKILEKPLTITEVIKEHDSGKLSTQPAGKIELKSNYPESVIPTVFLMIAAVAVGYLHYKKNVPLGPLTLVSFLLTIFVIFITMRPDFMNLTGLNNPETAPSADSWKYLLLFYAFIASVTPVWLLLQSRDYINSFLLYLGIFLVFAGYAKGALTGTFSEFNSPAFRSESIGLDLLPFVFITIACGAVSGFHALVSSGTTAKQINVEKDAKIIGYGGMIGESLLGLSSVIACTVGFTSATEWSSFYRTWSGIQGLAPQVGAYIFGTGRFLNELGISTGLGQGFIALIVVSFALTSLDSATRLLRYNIEEIAISTRNKVIEKLFGNRYISSLIACISIGLFAFLKIEENGVMKPAGLALWKVFGTSNQLLAGLALLTVGIYLKKIRKPSGYVFIPMVFILFFTLWAMFDNLKDFLFGKTPSHLLAFTGGVLILLTLWLLAEAILVWKRLHKSE